MKTRFAQFLSAGAMLACATAHAAPDTSQLAALVERYAQAQSAFDQAALKAMTADEYVEISPLGEVDSRDKMLSFYAPEQKRPAPQLQVDETVVRQSGDTALISARLSYTINQDGTPRNFALRAGYVARLVNQQWLLVSAQYTGIRPVKK